MLAPFCASFQGMEGVSLEAKYASWGASLYRDKIRTLADGAGSWSLAEAQLRIPEPAPLPSPSMGSSLDSPAGEAAARPAMQGFGSDGRTHNPDEGNGSGGSFFSSIASGWSSFAAKATVAAKSASKVIAEKSTVAATKVKSSSQKGWSSVRAFIDARSQGEGGEPGAANPELYEVDPSDQGVSAPEPSTSSAPPTVTEVEIAEQDARLAALGLGGPPPSSEPASTSDPTTDFFSNLAASPAPAATTTTTTTTTATASSLGSPTANTPTAVAVADDGDVDDWNTAW
ncbi:uncharacterized protein AMSG_07268 [Thecamonas trahens ATCC 50062]|uniref:Arf-GAP domain-containing protein n=1 Tax=Thecamonas trahens ATCC 50062 TaxID=461836 RepID=A0A0L0DGL9_THETB|nr:hypothetical protein AMSG_07268 [Thecamonas trahens ATCC 50062]KNC51266.1 hypothetical protein AMSG_07268 [Thecamonas trahens ATCC 50062]|eukprot:XP_013756195.1 hypothetical protein AMSG_07268 [Thecamonas trahens ATCC 50062]